MSLNNLIDRELEELTCVKTRSFVFPDNFRRKITLMEIYWRWYDRLISSFASTWTEENFLRQALDVSQRYDKPLDWMFEKMVETGVSDYDRCGVNVALTKEEWDTAYLARKRMTENMAFRLQQAAEIKAFRAYFTGA